MRYVAAYLLAGLGGNASPSAKDIKKILGSVGIEADEDRVDKVLEELNGKDINEIIASGREKLQSVPSGGGGAPAAAAGAGAGGAGKAEEAAEEAKKPPSEPEESDDDMGFGLFD